jgi:hypothetical protein
MMNTSDITLFIDPFSFHFEDDRLFDSGIATTEGENIIYLHLRNWFEARSIEVHTADRLMRGELRNKTNIFISLGLQKRYREVTNWKDVILSAYFAFESPVVEPHLYRVLPEVQKKFRRVYSFSDNQSLAPFLPRPLKAPLLKFELPYPQERVHEDLWRREDRKFLVVINHNKLPAVYINELYTERMRAIEFFAQTGELDLYGRGWDGPSFQMGIGWMPGTLQHAYRAFQRVCQKIRPVPWLVAARKIYRGSVPSKLQTLGSYTFSLCFDNVILSGWITEKIFDCFVAGNIPVYWGAPDVTEYIPAECFIDMRRFKDYAELRDYLRELDEREIRAYRENGRAYLASEAFQKFSKRVFTERLGQIVQEDTGVQLL